MQAELKHVRWDELAPSKDNVRKSHDPAKHAELVASVREKGIITPLIVRPIAQMIGGAVYEIAAGHRRYKAAHAAEVWTIPVSVRAMDDREFREVMLTENLQRVDPDPLDEADAYQLMIDELQYDVPTLALRFGKSETYVRARLVLTQLAPVVRTALEQGQIELGHAVLLARVSAPAQTTLLRDRLFHHSALAPSRYREVVAQAADEDLGAGNHVDDDYEPTAQDGARVLPGEASKTTVSIAELRAAMAAVLLPLTCVKWDRDDARLVAAAGSCTACPKRTGANPMLFAELNADDDRCPDAACYQDKTIAWLTERAAAVRTTAPNLVVITTKRRLAIKALDGQPVLRLDRDWKPTKAGSRGSVPAIVVESDLHSVGDQWAELGVLRDVRMVPKAKTLAPGATQKGKVPAAGSDAVKRAEFECAQERFSAGVRAVIRAIDASSEDPADRRDAAILLLVDDSADVDTEYMRDGQGRTDTRWVAILAGLTVANIDVPSWWTGDQPRASIEPDTQTFAVPAALIEFAATAGVDALAVWSAALVNVSNDALFVTEDDRTDDWRDVNGGAAADEDVSGDAEADASAEVA